MTIDYRPGMPYDEFLEMMAERRGDAVAELPGTELPIGPPECVHPYADIQLRVRGRRATATQRGRIMVDLTCDACGVHLRRVGFPVPQ